MTSPRADDAAVTALYDDESYYESRSMGEDAEEAWVERARGILDDIGFTPSSVLDCGAGEGHLVHALRALGVHASGVEPSAAGRAAARRRYGFELHARISELSGPFDLVTLIHVLEHVTNPVAMLRELPPRLRPNGVLFIEVPHAGSVDMWRPRRRREILDLPFHLYHFVPSTLCRIVEQAGLHVVEVRLFNPDIIEWALDLKARLTAIAAGKSADIGQQADGGGPASETRTRPWASLWARRMLPWLRRRFPGRKFQLLAMRGRREARP
jgi:2-polyprenyl-3-methyl-5-hydroxy-6-metoxy-1,4-benzoquinol methylase